jgi:TPR repeat protein
MDVQYLYRKYGPSSGLDKVAVAIRRRLLDHAVRTNSSAAHFSASLCFALGLGVTANISKSAEFMSKAARSGSYHARGLSATMATLAAIKTRDILDSSAKKDDQNVDLIHFDDFGMVDWQVSAQSKTRMNH